MAKKKNANALLADVAQALSTVTNRYPPSFVLPMPSGKKYAQRKGKLYELKVAAEFMKKFRSTPGSKIKVQNLAGTYLVTPGSPAAIDRAAYSWFELTPPGHTAPKHELWLSVQFWAYSACVANWPKKKVAPKYSQCHELDVGLIEPGVQGYPTYDDVHAGATCKATAKPSKAQIREALGLRSELGFPLAMAVKSTAPWLEPTVPAAPASPLYFYASAPSILNYVNSIRGVYLRNVAFP
jgi:hypothetical protein